MKRKLLSAFSMAMLSCFAVNSYAQFTGAFAGTNITTGVNNAGFGDHSMHFTQTGSYNTAIGQFSLHMTQGSYNTVSGYNSMSIGASGSYNTASGYNSLHNNTGNHNTAIGDQSMLSNTAGRFNASTGTESLKSNTTGNYNTGIGTRALDFNTTGSYNTALGFDADVAGAALTNATAIGNGTVVNQSNTMKFGNQAVQGWGFGADPVLANQALVVGIFGATPGNGAFCTPGGTWTNSSSRELKEGFIKQDPQTVLNKINAIPITKWKYKGTNEYHIGPVAEDFYSAFEVGSNNKSISTIDPSGIALLGIQALSKKQDELANENKQLKAEITELNRKIDALLEKSPDNTKSTTDVNQYNQKKILLTDASLEQNRPNPLSKTTSINYNVPMDVKNAQLIITDNFGKTVKHITLNAGKGVVNIDASALGSGMYNYTLSINGKSIESKRMIVAH